jgi:hypothetical protein
MERLMQTYNIKAALVAEANKAASFSRIKIPGQYIFLEVEQFLEKIAAPKDLQGFYYVAQTLASLLQQTDNVLKKALQLSDYLSAALLVDGELYLSKAEVATYKKTTAGSYWAKESPLYLLLFGASGFKKSTEDKLFLTAFIKHFIQCKKTLEDPSIQPKEHTRSEEVCRAFRWLQHKNSPTFNVKLFSSSIKNWSPGEIATAIDGFLVGARFEKATIRYSRTLYKFFANDWSNIKLKGANGPQKTPRSGGGTRVTTKPVVEPVSKTLVPAVVVTNEEGVDVQDTEILRTHITNTIDSENDRAKYERNSIGAIFDEELQKIGSIDITKALRQKNNLILSSRLLLSRGSLQLLKSLCERRLSETERHDASFAICCMLSTGISLPELSKLKIYRSIQGSENGIAVIKDQVFWQFKHRSSALRPAGQPQYFYGSDEWVYTPCSIVVSNYIQNNSFEHDSCLFETPEHQLRIKIDKLLQRMSENLKTMNISISMIESFLQRFVDASDTVDPVVLDFSYQQEIYAT